MNITKRPRRLRLNQNIRNLVAESSLSPQHLVCPVFITEDTAGITEIESMPDVYRYNINQAILFIESLMEKGIYGVALFPNTPNHCKDENGTHSYNSDTLMNRAIRAIKDKVPQCVIFADVALDPYTTHGHDGVLDKDGYVLNDETVAILEKQAVEQAAAGADVICPSDMMDGRIGAIRTALDMAGYKNTLIMSYAAKYASGFYGPFRDAVGSNSALKGDKKSYQMDYRNTDEALREVALDIDEGADMVMVKPGMPYLDIVYRVKNTFSAPTCVYQVSGEYTMLHQMVSNGLMSQDAIVESVMAFRRAGADIIFTYFAPVIADAL